jgi:outer membrane lipoprotein-sorting protein
MAMKVVTEHWTREMTLEFWSQGKDRSLVRILAPQKEKGTATLKAAENIWNYLPKVNRVIKVPTSMMGGAWMGSHFTNDELVKESRMAEDYDFATSFEGERGGERIVEISCTPKAGAAVVWGKVVVAVRQGDWMPISIAYLDEDLKLARTMTFSDLKVLGGRTVPTVSRMVPADKPRELTEVRYQEVAFDLALPEDLFSLRALQK